MIGPATNSRVEVGLNAKSVPASDRAIEMPANSMCKFKVNLARVNDVDDELIEWIRRAYDEAG